MITTKGNDIITEKFAGVRPQIAESIALGVGTTAATVNDTDLAFEVLRIPVTSVAADLTTQEVVFKGQIAGTEIKTVYEIAIFSDDPSVTNMRRFSLTSPQTSWTNATIVTTNARASDKTVKVDYVTSGTTNAEIADISEDLSGFGDADSMQFYFYATTNLSSLRVRMGTNSTNYYEYVMTSPTSNGYNTYKFLRSAATVVGTPAWDTIQYLAIRPSATAGGAGSVFMDTIKIQESTLTSESYLVARRVLGTPYTVNAAIVNEIEYRLGMDIV